MITQSLSRTSAAVGGAEIPAPAAKAAGPNPGSDFASVVASFAADTVETLRAAEATATAGVAGRASVQQVVEAVLGVEQQLQAAVAVRDKVVSAYLEISRMAI
jgi:flagellar hook-basal body complex protein FliE